MSQFHRARWWSTQDDGRILCSLCPRLCKIPEGSHGFCFIRQNHDGVLVNLGYGQSTGFAVDPIEKKPLNHFFPGIPVLSFGTAGCNLGCRFCQNWSISKASIDAGSASRLTPESIVALARRQGCPGIAYTYNDPVIWSEFVIDVARVAREQGIKNIFVTAGYVTPEAREEVFEFIDATNVDLKGFTERFYASICAGHLEPVRDTLRWLVHATNVWTEITTLLIPGLNDSAEEIQRECDWILSDLGPDVPVHFTAFHPDWKMTERPSTPAATLLQARSIALASGIRYCYVGNVHTPEGQTTYCPSCRTELIRRDWYNIGGYALRGDTCERCGTKIPGRFSASPPESFFGRQRRMLASTR